MSSNAHNSRQARPGDDDHGRLQRIEKILSEAGGISRRRATELIHAQQVTINGEAAAPGAKVNLDSDSIRIDGVRIAAPSKNCRYILLNKPAGYVTTRSDPEKRSTVMDLIPARIRRKVVPVGRLDYHTEGLLLLSDDGDFSQHVMHPRYGCKKTYEVKVKGVPAGGAIVKLTRGITLFGKRTRPVSISAMKTPRGPRKIRNNSWWSVVLTEGRTRQIREMFFRIGHPVMRLRRVAIGSLKDHRLPSGAWRDLTEHEIRALLQIGDCAEDRARPAPARPRTLNVGRTSKPTARSPR